MMGKVVLSHLLCTYIGFFLFGMVCASLGILISSFTESPLLAIIISEAAMLLLILMDSVSQTALFSSIPVVSDILSWFSNLGKFNAFSQGLIRLSDLVGYLTEILLFLIWTVISVEKDAGAGGNNHGKTEKHKNKNLPVLLGSWQHLFWWLQL